MRARPDDAAADVVVVAGDVADVARASSATGEAGEAGEAGERERASRGRRASRQPVAIDSRRPVAPIEVDHRGRVPRGRGRRHCPSTRPSGRSGRARSASPRHPSARVPSTTRRATTTSRRSRSTCSPSVASRDRNRGGQQPATGQPWAPGGRNAPSAGYRCRGGPGAVRPHGRAEHRQLRRQHRRQQRRWQSCRPAAGPQPRWPGRPGRSRTGAGPTAPGPR